MRSAAGVAAITRSVEIEDHGGAREAREGRRQERKRIARERLDDELPLARRATDAQDVPYVNSRI